MKQIKSIDIECLSLQSQIREFSRKVKAGTQIRCLFSSFKHQIKGHPKKEYLRCKLIRFHKRANRKIKLGKKLYNSIKKLSECGSFIWNKMTESYLSNAEILDNVSLTVFEPIKLKVKAKSTCLESRSFNTEFCVKYFEHPAVRESFFYLVEYFFSDLDPGFLSKTLGFSCCDAEIHNLDCAYKWLLMKRYLNQFLIEDLGFEAWFPNESSMLPPLHNFLVN